MNTVTRWEQSRGLTPLQEQVIRLLRTTPLATARVMPTWQPGRHQWTYTKPRTNW